MSNTMNQLESHSQGLSLILPCRSEVAALPQVLAGVRALRAALLATAEVPLEVILVDDQSQDDSALKAAQLDPNVRILSTVAPGGYGRALKLGMSMATREWIAIMDCDGTFWAADFVPLWQQRSPNRLIWGDRSGSSDPLIRRFGNRLYSWFIFALTGTLLPDPCSGLRMFSRHWCEQMSRDLPDGLDFTLAMGVWAYRRNLALTPVAVCTHPRKGTSKLNVLLHGWLFFMTILRYRWQPLAK